MSLSRSIALLALALAAACGGGGNGGGGPGPTPTTLAKTATATGDSQVASAGTPLPTPFRVVVRDQNGDPIANVAVTWAVGVGGGSISSAGNTDANGVASATRTLGPNAGTQTATATRAGLSGSPITFSTFSQIQGATSLELNGGGSQSDTVLSILGTPVSVVARDHTGAVVPNVIVSWSGTGGGTPSQTTDTTDGSGVSAVTLTLGGTAGPQAAVATVTGLVGSPRSISATATAGNATQMALNGGNAQTGCPTSLLPTAHSVLVKDGHNNPKGLVTVTWVVGDGGGSVSSLSPITGSNGIASVTRTLGPSAGSNTDTAKVNALTGSQVTFTATGVTLPDGNVTVGPQIQYSPTTVTICSGGTVHFTWAAMAAVRLAVRRALAATDGLPHADERDLRPHLWHARHVHLHLRRSRGGDVGNGDRTVGSRRESGFQNASRSLYPCRCLVILRPTPEGLA